MDACTTPSFLTLARPARFAAAIVASLLLLLSTSFDLRAQVTETTITDCTEGGLNDAINAIPLEGGDLTLDCPAGTTISITGLKTINTRVAIRAAEMVTLAADGRTRHFYVRPAGALTLENLTLSGGVATYGGAIYVEGQLFTNDVTFTGNRAIDYGGGVYLDRAVAELTNSRFLNNSAEEGGALFVDFQSTASLVSSTVSGNSARYGGGIAVGYRGDLNIIDSTISENQARFFGDGGGIYVDDRARLSVAGSTIRGNSATYGGGIDVEERAVATIVDSTLSSNSAREGAGVSVSEGILEMLNSTISGNSADLGGGGIYLEGGSASLRHVTVANNQVRLPRQAAGVYVEGRGALEFYNSVFDNGAAANCYFGGRVALTVVVASASSDRSCGSGNMQIVTSAALAPLGNYGGATETHLPLADSPLLDAGDIAYGAATDQRGQMRPDGSAPDIGAVERQEGEE